MLRGDSVSVSNALYILSFLFEEERRREEYGRETIESSLPAGSYLAIDPTAGG